MVSSDFRSALMRRLRPLMAIFRHELDGLASSWLLRLWVLASGILALLMVTGQWGTAPTARFIALLFAPYLIFPWYIAIVMIGAGGVSNTRTDSLADGILSRPITRSEYLLGAYLARLVAVVAAYLIVVVPATLLVALADRPVPVQEPVTLFGVFSTIGVVALVLMFLVSIAMLLGTLLRRALVAVLILIVAWPLSGAILGTYQLEELSPISLNQAIVEIAQRPAPWTDSDEDAPDAAPDLTASADEFLRVFSSMAAPPPKKRQEDFFESSQYEDASLWRVVLGYAIPSLVCLGLSVIAFSRQDL